MRSVGCCFLMFQMKARYGILHRNIQMKNLISKCTAHQLSQAYCTVFSIWSTRLLIFINVNFSFNFMHEVPSSATFNFKSKGLVSSANLSELEWIPSKLLRAKTGEEKALDAFQLLEPAACAATQRAVQNVQSGTAERRDGGDSGRRAAHPVEGTISTTTES